MMIFTRVADRYHSGPNPRGFGPGDTVRTQFPSFLWLIELHSISFCFSSPPTPEEIRRSREKILNEIKMYEAAKEITVFFCFLVLLMTVVLHHRNPNMFLLTKTLSETFDEVDAYATELSAVRYTVTGKS